MSSTHSAAGRALAWRDLIEPRRWSIAVRLTLLYTLWAAVTLTATVAFVIQVLARDMGEDEYYFVMDRFHMIQETLLKFGLNPVILDHELLQASGSDDPDQRWIFYSRIIDAEGRVVIETGGMDKLVPASVFPVPEEINPVSTAPIDKEHYCWESPDGRYYVLRSGWAISGGDNQRVTLQVALDESDEQYLLIAFQNQTYAALALAILLFAWVGIYITRGGMRPLADIADKAERITSKQLHERMETEHLPPELVVLAESFNHMLVRLEDSFGRIERFSADIAHELRAPLHNLMGQTEVALTQDRPPEEYREVLASNLEECNRLTRMINGLLFLARAESPQTLVERKTFEIRKELERVREFHQVVAEERDITLDCQGEGRINANPLMFQRALTNLVSNALRYTPSRGQVTLAVDTPEDGWVEVSVRDNGCGIAEEHLPNIFDRLYRPDRGHDLNDTGAGLGLAIVKSIMDLHGGHVMVHSQPGKGSTFTLRFAAGAQVE